MEVITFVGVDLSLNHFGVVFLNKDGSVLKAHYGTGAKKYAFSNALLIRHNILGRKVLDPDNYAAFRRAYLRNIFDSIFFELYPQAGSTLVCIEDYSFSSKSQATYQIGEIGGLVRNTIYDGGFALRTVDPASLKMFFSGNGSANKFEMYDAALADENFYCFFGENNICSKLVNKKKSDIEGPITDLVDAYALAKAARVESLLRGGEVSLDKLKEFERRMFLRVTMANPVNILDRPFIWNGYGEDNKA